MKLRYQLLTAAMLALPMAAQAADCVNGPNAPGTCTVPLGVTSMTIHAIGGGGGGGMDQTAIYGAAGGGGGSHCGRTVTVTPGSTLTVVVGSGGAGATTAGSSGAGGGYSEVTGTGISGLRANGGSGGGPNDGGAGGTIDACTLAGASAFAGGNGGASPNLETLWDTGGGGGGGAGSAGDGSNGVDAVVTDTTGAAGGPGGAGAPAGGAGGEGGDAWGAPGSSVDTSGAPGNAPGGSGGGAGVPCGDIYTGNCAADFAGRCNEVLVQNLCSATCQVCATPTTGGSGADGVVLMSFEAAPIAVARPIPVLSLWGLGLLGLLLTAASWVRRR